MPAGTTRANTKEACTSRVVSSYMPDQPQEPANPQLHVSTPPEIPADSSTGGGLLRRRCAVSGVAAGAGHVTSAGVLDFPVNSR